MSNLPLEEERGVKPASLAHQRATDPIALQWELQECYFLKVTLLMLRDYCCMVEQVILPIGKVWLMHIADTQCTVVGEGGGQSSEKKIMFNSFVLAYNVNFISK